MILSLTGDHKFLWKVLERGFKENHINTKYNLKFDVTNTENIRDEYREAIKKSYDVQTIDESDILVCFLDGGAQSVEKEPQEPQQDQAKQPQPDQAASNPEAKNEAPAKEQPADQEQVSEADEDDDKKPVDEPRKEDIQKKQAQDDDGEKKTDGNNEMSLKLKEDVIKAMKRCLYVEDDPNNQIEPFDVDFNGQKTFFVKISIKK